MVVISHFNHVWLKEGFAKFMEIQYLREHSSSMEMEYRLFQYQQDYLSECQRYTVLFTANS